MHEAYRTFEVNSLSLSLSFSGETPDPESRHKKSHLKWPLEQPTIRHLHKDLQNVSGIRLSNQLRLVNAQHWQPLSFSSRLVRVFHKFILQLNAGNAGLQLGRARFIDG